MFDRGSDLRPCAVIEAEETAKAAPVHDLERRLRIRQTVERLDHQHLEHEDRVHRWAPALPAIGMIKRRIQIYLMTDTIICNRFERRIFKFSA